MASKPSIHENSRELSRVSELYRLLACFGLGLLLLTAFRLIFLFTYANWPELENLGMDLLVALWMGFRFDLSSVATASVFIFLVSSLLGLLILLFKRRTYPLPLWKQRIHSLYAFVFLLWLGVVASADFLYYSYFSTRLEPFAFGFFVDDTRALLKTFWANYPILPIGLFGVLFTGLVFWVVIKTEKWSRCSLGPNGHWQKCLLFLSVFVLLAILARGSVDIYALNTTNAFVSSNRFINHLAPSPTHLFNEAFIEWQSSSRASDRNLHRFGYHSNLNRAFRDLLGPEAEFDFSNFLRQTKQAPLASRSPHVVLVMAESLGTSGLEWGSGTIDLVGELGVHLDENPPLRYMLPGSNGTIGSISSLLAGIPHRIASGHINETRYSKTFLPTSPAPVFQRAGYETHFVYGGSVGWRRIGDYALTQGYQQIHGEADIGKVISLGKRNSHDWGMYDDDLFAYIQYLLEKDDTPKMIVVLTTSNHPPYELPNDYKTQIEALPEEILQKLSVSPEMALKRLRSFRYANDSLGKFLTEVKAGALARKTVVGVTGDHSFWIQQFADGDVLNKYAVPFFLYPAGEKINLNPSGLASHHDIFPTLYHLVLDHQVYFSFGENILDPDFKNFAISGSGLVANTDGAAWVRGRGGPQYLHQDGEGLSSVDKPSKHLENEVRRYQALMALLDLFLMEVKKWTSGTEVVATGLQAAEGPWMQLEMSPSKMEPLSER